MSRWRYARGMTLFAPVAHFRSGTSRSLLRKADVRRWETDGTATVKASDWPYRVQGWFITPLRSSAEHVSAVRVEPDQNGDLVAIEVRVFPAAWLAGGELGAWGVFETAPHASSPVTVRALRDVKLGVRDTRRIAAEMLELGPESGFMIQELTEMGWDFKGEAETVVGDLSQRPGRRGRPDSAYLAIAIRYAQLVEYGNTRPIKTMAEDLDRTPQQVRDLVRRCRDRKLLTKSVRGLAHGTLTDKAEALLELGETNGEH